MSKYYEKNLTTGEVTTYYYLGDRLVAQRKGTTVSYIHQDHLTGTSVISSSGGAQTGTIKYRPYGDQRSSTGTIPTDKRFTGQRLDGTSLYYFGARYHDPMLARFISADSLVQSPRNPQAWNRYSYALNNPLKYVDPTGHWVYVTAPELRAGWDMFKSVAPDEAAMMEKPGVSYYIGWSFEPEGGFCVGEQVRNIGAHMMGIDVDLQGTWSIAAIAVVIGHESFHALEGKFADSVFEEVGANKFGTEIGARISRRLLQSPGEYGEGMGASVLLDQNFYRKLNVQRELSKYDLTKTGSALVAEMQSAQKQLVRYGGPVYGAIPLLPPSGIVNELRVDAKMAGSLAVDYAKRAWSWLRDRW